MLRRLLLLVVVAMMASPVSAAVILQVDFNSNQDSGGDSTTAGDPGLSAAAHNQAGWSSYHANHEVAAEFSTANYGGITVTPAWPNTTDNRVQQSIDRGAVNDNNWDNSLGYLNLVTDWIGIDTRTGNGGNGNWDGATGTPTYMTLTLGGLAAGSYEWTSFHHDTEHCHGPFAVWISTDGGATFTPLPDGLMTDGTEGGTPDSGTVYGGPDPYSLPSTYHVSFETDGTNDVVLRFAPYTGSAVHRQIWGMNGFELAMFDSPVAMAPRPTSGASDVPRDGTVLTWRPSQSAVSHDVYLGTSYDDIDDGTTASDAYRGRQDANSFDPGRLELGRTYYWRVDDVASDGTVGKGNVWSFTVEPAGIVLAGDRITATASSSNSGGEGPEKTIDGSGLDADDLHSTDLPAMWISNKADPNDAWIQYEFDRVYPLHQMLVWNHNSPSEFLVGFGIKEAIVEYSLDGLTWSALEPQEFAKAPGEADYAANTAVEFNGAAAKYVKITAKSNWEDLIDQYGLSEVRFMIIPVFAREPQPQDGATDVVPQTTLGWRAGRDAAAHDVYLGSDVNDLTLVDTVDVPSLDVSSLLALDQTYHWKVDEVNDLGDPAVWEGQVWSFSTSAVLIVEDFEGYTDDFEAGEAIWQGWIDGLEDSAKGGSVVGYAEAPFAERQIVHSGLQSMNLSYDNTTGSAFSEATRTFDGPQDWTVYGVKGLTLWFHGDPLNTAATMYVKVNGRKVSYGGDAEAVLRKVWQFWYIDLADFAGVNLAQVNELTIGLEGGVGVVYIDDIGLSPKDRQLVTPTEPDAANLVAHYAFEGNADDSTGAHPGALNGAPQFAAGQVGQAIQLDGVRDYVLIESAFDLPVYSAAVWFKVEGGMGARDLVSVHNSDGQHGLLLEITDTGTLRFLHRAPLGGTGGTDIRTSTTFDDGGWYHATIVKSADATTAYINGELIGSAADETAFGDVLDKITLGVLRFDDLSRYLPGGLDEVYFYSRPLSQDEIAWLAGRTSPYDRP